MFPPPWIRSLNLLGKIFIGIGLFLNACNESQSGLRSDEASVLESAKIDVENSETGSDGANTLDDGAIPGLGPVTVMPAPTLSNPEIPQATDPDHQVQQVPGIPGKTDPEPGLEASGSMPPISEATTLEIYDPFCNCYKTPFNDGINVGKAGFSGHDIGEKKGIGAVSADSEDEDSDD